MRLSPQRFNQQLADQGQRMLWQRARVCPCRESHSGGAKEDCPICDGRGTFWDKGIPTRAGVVGAKILREFAAFGAWEDGDVMVSIPSNTPMWNAGENDRVVFADGHQPFQVVMRHNSTAKLRFPLLRIERCFWLGPNGSTVLECTAPRVDPDTGALSWLDLTQAPDPGAQFTIAGQRRPEYFLWRYIPVSRAHYNGLDFPKRATLKPFDLFKG